MWKSLITVSIIFGILAGWLRYQTTTDLKHERTALIDSDNNLDLAKKYQNCLRRDNLESIWSNIQQQKEQLIHLI